MTRIFNLGSVNIDHVYQVPHLVRPGETLSSTRYSRGAGGKGFNQSIALARAGAAVSHIGCIGSDGQWLRDQLEADGVDCRPLLQVPEPTGHAIIQVLPGGENAIVLHAGANKAVSPAQIEGALREAEAGDWLLCQNETNEVPLALEMARKKGMKTAYNAAPADPAFPRESLRDVDLLLVNETEACALGNCVSPTESVTRLRAEFPGMEIILTLGAEGAIWSRPDCLEKIPAPVVKAVDTTAAGDTFTGYCLAALMDGQAPALALVMACKAASLSVTRPGAAQSIPWKREVT
jgi:ribokinase